ncbi:MAG: KEOPS complex N(6)-L-threonylcarbamoyladenine synthase Kae1 [Candidatus Micrarchaeota archaeon]|nr:KEOPS complex N(6)-L-threonylcarbamoyladenine synthase Kae1 [Candidatus Micrarchaeota archaeon]
MISIGFESTAHTLGIGIYDGRSVRANEYATYSQPFGGIKPGDAADSHSVNFESVLTTALNRAGIKLSDVGLVGYSKGPGMAPCLRISRAAAVFLAERYKIPIIPVHHSVAHIEIGMHECGFTDPLVVYVSGGNTQLLVKRNGRYAVLGETLDIGLGNAIDTLAREMRLERAHGGEVERIAKTGKYIELPYTVKGMDFAFSGLVTRCSQLLREHSAGDIAFSFQETAFAMLCEAAERALMLAKKKEILLCGGVAQNQRLQEMLRGMSEENNAKFGVAAPEYNRDNGAMIAYTAHYLYAKYNGNYPDKDIVISPKYRIEDAPA